MVVQGFIQSGLVNLQAWRFHGQPAPMFNYSCSVTFFHLPVGTFAISVDIHSLLSSRAWLWLFSNNTIGIERLLLGMLSLLSYRLNSPVPWASPDGAYGPVSEDHSSLLLDSSLSASLCTAFTQVDCTPQFGVFKEVNEDMFHLFLHMVDGVKQDSFLDRSLRKSTYNWLSGCPVIQLVFTHSNPPI